MDPDLEDMMVEYEERAAIMEYEGRSSLRPGGLPRQEAERLAWLDVFGEEMQ